MKKKRFILISLVMALLPFIGVCVDATAKVVPLQMGIFDPTSNQTNPQKSPVLVPEVSLEAYTLSFNSSCYRCELRLLDEDGVLVYSTTIISSTLVLPSYLSGDYELQIIRGIYCFYGDINL